MSLDDQLRSLADVVERLEALGVKVTADGFGAYDHVDDGLVATVELDVPAKLDTDDTPVGSAYPAEAVEVGDAQDKSGDENDDGTGAEQDTTTDDADASDDTNHDIERERLTPAKKDVVDALAGHGELSSSEVETVTGRSYKHLSDLEERDIVESRKDPDDGRRHLYSLSVSGPSLAEGADGEQKDYEDNDDNQEDADEDQSVADATEEIDAAATNGGLTVADIDWLDESSFHVAVAESSGLQELRDTLGWLDEDGDLAALVQGMDATDDLPEFQEAET